MRAVYRQLFQSYARMLDVDTSSVRVMGSFRRRCGTVYNIFALDSERSVEGTAPPPK